MTLKGHTRIMFGIQSIRLPRPDKSGRGNDVRSVMAKGVSPEAISVIVEAGLVLTYNTKYN